MSINSGGKPYNQNFPIPNTDNDSRGFRDNFTTIKFAIEALQSAASGPASVLQLSASPQTNGTILLHADFKSTGFTLPASRPAAPETGSLCAEGGQLLFYSGSAWQNFIPLVGDTLTIQNVVVNNKLTLNYTPTSATDAVSKAWVETYVASNQGGGQGGVDQLTLNRISALETGLEHEAVLRLGSDNSLNDAIAVERGRIDLLSQEVGGFQSDLSDALTVINDQINQVTQSNQTMASELAQTTNAVNSALQGFETALQGEVTARTNADAVINNRIDQLSIANIAGLSDALLLEAQARINGDQQNANNLSVFQAAINQELSSQSNVVSGYTQAIYQANSTANQALDLITSGLGNYLNITTGGTVSGPVVLDSNLTMNGGNFHLTGGSFTLTNSQFYMPSSNFIVDAAQAILFRKLPNTVGGGDGAFITYDESNDDYAFLRANTRVEYDAVALVDGREAADAAYEFSCLRIGVTNDTANGFNGDSLALEPAANLFLNPGHSGASHAKYGRFAPYNSDFANTAVYVGSAKSWSVEIKRSTGNIHTKGSVQADLGVIQPSDARLKTDFAPIDSALDKIDALNGLTYSYLADVQRRRHSGLLAQDAQGVLPEAVTDDGDRLLLNYAAIIPLLVEGIKELRREVRELKG